MNVERCKRCGHEKTHRCGCGARVAFVAGSMSAPVCTADQTHTMVPRHYGVISCLCHRGNVGPDKMTGTATVEAEVFEPGKITLKKPGRFSTSAPLNPPPRGDYRVTEVWGLTVLPRETANERKRRQSNEEHEKKTNPRTRSERRRGTEH